jgi:hypothetical protein
MTTHHDTPEAVEAFASLLDIREDQRVMDPVIAAMLRRLHQRAVDAEQESTEAMARILRENDDLRAALATARAALEPRA